MSEPGRSPEDSLTVPDYAAIPLGEFLDAVAAAEPAPGGGAAAAVSVALAAALSGMSARLSGEQLYDAPALADRADRLRGRAARLAGDDAGAYESLLAARRLPRGPEREAAAHGAAERAAAVPLEIAEAARETAGLAAQFAAEGNPSLRGDAVTAACLAEGAARSAAELVSINAGEDDWRAVRARRMCEETAALARCALGKPRLVHGITPRQPP